MPSPQLRFTLEATAAAVRGARHRVSAAVVSLGVPVDEDLLFRVEVVASELLTNGLRHAGGPLTVEVSWEGGLLVVAVLDGSPVLPGRREADGDCEGGRGLALVDGLCLLHGVERTADGKRCWAVVPVPAAVGRGPEVMFEGGRDGGDPELSGLWSITPGGVELLMRLLPATYALEP
ncbi:MULTISPECIES: ATP-binding protein [unclassified Streptomyces]|uniref:ATP-binding protein n=1 Tax=unclassified Streptomyces TaxID=2593676 RepID=UPI0024410A5E|nr:ATP-binding protein [Streptomyces sp. DH41]MDG9722742.1 ATP-binding protein [Streptomyces sp. DH41]